MTTSNSLRNSSNITTYGALILPFDREKAFEQAEVQADPEVVTEQQGAIISAIENGNQKGIVEEAIENEVNAPKSSVTQKIKDLATYMNDNRDKVAGIATTITSKFSGIAVAQALMTGKVTSREALDYLFMGFAPALGVQGSLMGYSGLNQMKEALFDGSINVGAFISGFTRTLKGGKDLADMLTKKQTEVASNVIEFDLTISHNENYQSETPDRRVQSGQSLNEFVHNMPETITVNCALQEGKRYSKDEFRAILKYLRERKETVQLVLGDELFDSLILTDFNPNHDCTRSGMDYSLSFKKITRSDIDTNTEVTIQKMPIKDESSSSGSGLGSSSKLGGSSSMDMTNIATQAAGQLERDTAVMTNKIFGSTSIALRGANVVATLGGLEIEKDSILYIEGE